MSGRWMMMLVTSTRTWPTTLLLLLLMLLLLLTVAVPRGSGAAISLALSGGGKETHHQAAPSDTILDLDPHHIAHTTNTTIRIRFLVTVNDTWDPQGCMQTVPTPFLVSGRRVNQTSPIHVGNCDHGPLVFTVNPGCDDGVSNMTVLVTFHSSVIEDASPPSCSIPWNGTYLNPTESARDRSPLPSCFVGDSREGYHMTYYWFRLLEWQFFDNYY